MLIQLCLFGEKNRVPPQTVTRTIVEKAAPVARLESGLFIQIERLGLNVSS